MSRLLLSGIYSRRVKRKHVYYYYPPEKKKEKKVGEKDLVKEINVNTYVDTGRKNFKSSPPRLLSCCCFSSKNDLGKKATPGKYAFLQWRFYNARHNLVGVSFAPFVAVLFELAGKYCPVVENAHLFIFRHLGDFFFFYLFAGRHSWWRKRANGFYLFFFLIPFWSFSIFMVLHFHWAAPSTHIQLGAVSLLLFFFWFSPSWKIQYFIATISPCPLGRPAAVEKHILLKFGIFLFRGMDGCRPPRKKANRVQKRYLAKMATATQVFNRLVL